MVLEVLAFALGVALVALATSSAIRTMVVPRGQSSNVVRVTFDAVRALLRLRLGRSPDYATRDRVMALFAPLGLVALPVVWLALVLAGYTAMYWALDTRPLRAAFTLSGSSLFTLGFSTPGDLPAWPWPSPKPGWGSACWPC